MADQTSKISTTPEEIPQNNTSKQPGNGNIGLKALSVFIAVLIWVLVAYNNDPIVTRRFSSIPVTVENEEELNNVGYAYEITDGSEVNITVRGKNSIVSGLSKDDFSAVADLGKLSVVNAVPIDVTANKYNDQLEITTGSTNTMKISLDELIEKGVPVEIVTEGDPADGYAVGTTTGKPNLVKVEGPKRLLSGAREIRVSVDVDGATGDITTTGDPVLYDNDGEEIVSPQITIKSTIISVEVEIWKTKTVGIEMSAEGTPADGYVMTSFDYEPKQIEIAAPDDVLEDLTTLDLGTVSVSGLTENYEADVEVSDLEANVLPDNVISADDSQDIKVQATIEELVTKKLTFSKDDLKVKNKGKYDISYSKDNEYYFTIEGGKSLLEDVKAAEVAPWIDLNNLEEGTHTVRIHVKQLDNITVNGSSSIKVTLSEQE